MAEMIHCDEHGLCIAQCELCADEKHEREIAELERKLAVAREALKRIEEYATCDTSWTTARKALEEIK